MKRTFLKCSIIFLLLFSILPLASNSSGLISSDVPIPLFYNETQLVRLIPQAVDADGDNITFVFSAPLNATGEWQTGYDDAGIYNFTITAFDGHAYTEQTVLLIIQNVNRPPKITTYDIDTSETELITARYTLSDPDHDNLTVNFSEPLNRSGQWQTGYDDEGDYTSAITVNDNQIETTQVITIHVKDTNRLPIADKKSPEDRGLYINETQSVSFSVEAHDTDKKDVLNYTWFVDGQAEGNGLSFSYVSDYSSAGDHSIYVEISDGKGITTEHWKIHVANINRAPSLESLHDITLHENESYLLDIPAYDIDGDPLTYSISDPIGDDGHWVPSFTDAGLYPIHIHVTDGKLSADKNITLTALNVDRAPIFSPLSDVTLNEAEKLRFPLSVTDPDGDKLSFSVNGLQGVLFDGTTFVWSPSYDFVSLPHNFFGRFLSRLRIARFLYPPQKTVPVLVRACDSELCANQTFHITVQNTNRAPVLDPLSDITVSEGDLVALSPVSSDLDNDFVRFYYTSPAGRNGRWRTNFTDAGLYPIIVGATDGKTSTERTVRVRVQNKNRIPTFGRINDQSVYENHTIRFSVPISDPDGDKVSLSVEGLPPDAEFHDGIFQWTPSYDTISAADGGKKDYVVVFVAVEGGIFPSSSNSSHTSQNTSIERTIIKKAVKITVYNTNRPPVLTYLNPQQQLTSLTGKSVIFSARAFDPDGDKISYLWHFGFLDEVKGPNSLRRAFTTSGNKVVELIVSDGKDETHYRWFVRVGRAASPTVKKAFVQTVQKTTSTPQPAVQPLTTPPVQQPRKFVTVEVNG